MIQKLSALDYVSIISKTFLHKLIDVNSVVVCRTKIENNKKKLADLFVFENINIILQVEVLVPECYFFSFHREGLYEKQEK